MASQVRPDFNKLRDTHLSDDILQLKSKQSEKCWKEFLVANFNFVNECSFKVTEKEIAKITMSLQNWIDKRNSKEYCKRDNTGNFVKQEINIGEIYLADLGLNYEKGYCRTIVVIGKIEDMLLVIPTTTQSELFENAYHPKDNPAGNDLHRKVYTTNGFDNDCVLLYENTRIISQGRIIEGNKRIADAYTGECLYNEMMLHTFNTIFPMFYKQYNDVKCELSELKGKSREELLTKTG